MVRYEFKFWISRSLFFAAMAVVSSCGRGVATLSPSFSGDSSASSIVAISVNSTITAVGPTTADGTSTSVVTVTLKGLGGVALVGVTPTFSATNTGSTNSYGACSATNSSGSSTCTLSSTKAETKTLQVTSPITFTGGTVTFSPGVAVAAKSTITGSGPVTANGTSTSTISISLQDANSNPLVGVTPTFSATNTGSTNSYGACSATDASGNSSCTLASTKAETKTLQLTSPITFTGGTVTFSADTAVAANSTITGTGPVTANGTSTSTISITLRDANSNPVAGITPTFAATDTGTTNTYGPCSATNASGNSSCTLASTKAETKTLQLTSPVTLSGGTVTFSAGVAVSANSTITGTGPVTANGTSTSTISITLQDANSNPLVGVTPTFSATNTGATNSYGACSATNASGSSSCTLASTKAETKTLQLASPISFSGGTVTFSAGVAVAANSTITGTGPVTANGTSTSTISITLQDANSNPLVGVTPTFSATNTGTTNSYGACSATNASGSSSCTLASTKAETKTLQLASPISFSGGTVTFSAGVAVSANSTITGTGPVTANGTSTSTISITLQDANSNPLVGVTPTFSATNTGATNSYGACSATDASGSSSCTLASTKAETKTLQLASPISFSGGTVTFSAGVAVAANSTITGTGPVTANGTSTSTISITLQDTNSNPLVGVTPTFTATNTGTTNSYGACSATDASGNSSCTLASTKAETKTLQLASPISFSGGTVTFSAGVAVAANSTITGTGPVTANGTSTSTISITLQDANSNPLAGVTPTFAATNTGTTNSYGACSATDASGNSSCTLASTKAEAKTLQLTSPITFNGGSVTFSPGAVSAARCSIVGTGPKTADGNDSSTITIVLNDAYDNGISGVTPTFSATNTGTSNTYGACSATNSAGTSTCSLTSSNPETKTLSIATPVSQSGSTVVFTLPTLTVSNLTNNGLTHSGFVIGSLTNPGTTSKVQIKYDTGSWIDATGTTSWKVALPHMTTVPSTYWVTDSTHTVSVQVINALSTVLASTSLTVKKAISQDYNGDGYEDLVVGAPDSSISGTGRGICYVYYGSANGISSTPSVTLTYPGTDNTALFGLGPFTAGDLNGDGYADLALGASGTATNTGIVYVYYGSSSGIVNTVDVTLTIAGMNTGAFFGETTMGVGDVNSDGYDDLMANAWCANGAGTCRGNVYFYHGSSTGIPSNPSVTIVGAVGNSKVYARGVSGVGDVNGDGYPDFIAAATGTSPASLRVYYGSSSGIHTVHDVLITYPGADAGNNFGRHVSGVGDVNKDGYADFVVTAYQSDGAGTDRGSAYLFLGSSTGPSTTATTTWTGTANNEQFGTQIIDLGDVNNDGYSDFAIGNVTGTVGVYLGSSTGPGAGPDLTYTHPSVPSGTLFGTNLPRGVDLKGIGFPAMLIGANNDDTNGGSGRGAAYLYYSNGTTLQASPGATLYYPGTDDGAHFSRTKK